MIRLDSIEGNTQRLDGGAMYGNCPKALWGGWSPPDEANRILLACRALLARDGARTVLFEAGIGAFFEPKLRERYGVVETEHVLLRSLAEHGLTDADVDVVVLSHAHFDHAGGLLAAWQQGEPARLLFPRATFVLGRRAWQRACEPHLRDRASFIPELRDLLERSGRLELVDETSAALPAETYSFTFSDGHTPGLALARISTPSGPITFLGDLVPGTPWVHLPVTMGYDRSPELLVEEKKRVLDRVIEERGWVFYTHDPNVAVSRIERDDRGRYRAIESLRKLVWVDP
jgi:glyoxylase-like metal-dependent hydrolase (beta-lactamase superfamily II)